MEIKIPFKPMFERVMLSGQKTMTSRVKRYGKPGDWFEAFGCRFQLLEVIRKKLREVAALFFWSEGLEKPEEFIKVWDSLHPSGFQGDKLIWCHRFRRIKDKESGDVFR